MARDARALFPSEFAHVTIRGLGRRIIFEDDQDKKRFLGILAEKLKGSKATVYAWCLMDNHAHLLLRADRADLSKLMQRTEISYAQYFNGRHGHVGKVFQNRFNAQPITSESHLLAAIRYIHRNPLDIGEDVDQYAWSSYQEIVEGKGGIADSAAVLELFAGIDGFLSFHNNANEEDGFERIDGYRRRLDDAEAIDIALKAFGQSFADRITSMPKAERDKALAQLKFAGLSIRQIERLTGVGRGVIARA